MWQWRKPRKSPISSRRGSSPRAAAATSPCPSRSSGGTGGNPSAPYSRSSSGVGTNSLPRQSAAPASEKPRSDACLASSSRCCSLPVACTSTAPTFTGVVTTICALAPPAKRRVSRRSSCPANSCTPGSWLSRLNNSAGDTSATRTRTRSRTISERRRTSPATMAAMTPGNRASAERRPSASSAAWWESRNAFACRRKAMLLRMFSDVFRPNRGSLARRPSVAAASRSGSDSIPRTS